MSDVPITQEDNEPDDLFTVRKGRQAGMQIKLMQVAAMRLNKVMRSVRMPERPTYETKTISGRTQVHAMDEKSAQETEHGKADWEYYRKSLDDAMLEQNEKMILAILLMGTSCEIPDDGWEQTYEALGLDVPTHPDMRRANYLMTELDPSELTRLINKIMRMSGVSEETIQEAEETFRGEVRNGQEPTGSMANAATDSRRTARK